MPIKMHSTFIVNAHCSEKLKKWLDYQASLTDRLQTITGDTQLELIYQGWFMPDWWDINVIQIPKGWVFKREIVMKSLGVPYWYARSFIPKQCYDLEPAFFDRLKNESIKNLIFGSNKVQRITCLVYPIDAHCIEFYWLKKNIPDIDGVFWVRLAEFSFLQRGSFFLAELILPNLESLS